MGCGGSSDQNHIQIETDKLTVSDIIMEVLMI